MSFFDALADALQSPLRNAMCLVRGTTSLGVSIGTDAAASLTLGYNIPNDCNQPIPPEISPVVGRGQCDNVLYRVFWNVRRPDGQIVQWGPFTNVVGPITGIGEEWTTDFFNNILHTTVIFCPNDTEQGGVRKFGPYSAYTDATRAARSFIRLIERQDGQPDNCTQSNPPPNPTPQGPVTINLPDFPITFGGTTINLNGNATFNPIVNIPVYGGIHIPINVNLNPNIYFPGGINLPVYLRLPSLTINPSISFFNVSVAPEIKPKLSISVFPPSPEPSGEGLSYTTRLIGVRVLSTVAQTSPVSVINGVNGSTNLYVPRLATVRFVPPSFVSSQESIDIDVKTLDQFVPVPWVYGASSYTVLPNVGVTVQATPITAQVADIVRPE